MDSARAVRCSENEAAALFLLNKRQEMANRPNGLSENLDMTLSKAYGNICSAKTPIKTLKDLSQIKGVGKWVLTLMKGFFTEETSAINESPSKEAAPQKGKKTKGPKRYVPQKNSVAYALLITLYREMINGNTFMKKQELIDAAEASGLSRTSIGPDKAIGRPTQFGNSQRDWYTGWNCMKTLISKGLVVKSSCPAKYMLTDEGTEAARDCISRSGLEKDEILANKQNLIPCGAHKEKDEINSNKQNLTNCGAHKEKDEIMSNKQNLTNCSSKEKDLIIEGSNCSDFDDDPDILSHKKDILEINPVDISDSDSDSDSLKNPKKKQCTKLNTCTSLNNDKSSFNLASTKSSCETSGSNCKIFNNNSIDNTLAVPPYINGERFSETYQVILILDDRENFGSRSKKVVDSIRSQFNILVEVRRLPAGDAVWIARNKKDHKEFVLDFIVERKNVDDLKSSIRDNRYRDQKLRLQRCGIKKLIYLVEGDPNSMEAADSIKTACFTTEILEGFDVQRTLGFADTIRKYGYLTKSIVDYYDSLNYDNYTQNSRVRVRICSLYNEFVRKCQDLEKMTVSDVFALQLMQVPQVTEEVALNVVEMYPTLFSLAQAYSLLEGNIRAQEEMLNNGNNLVGLGASRNIFKLVWGSEIIL